MQYVESALRAFGMAGILAISALLGAAHAGESTEETQSETKGPQVSANAGLASDYRFRGFTQTREHAALQGGFDVTWRQFYVGLWATNVDFGSVYHAGRWQTVADYEVDTYVGYKHTFMGFQTDVRAIFYNYPGSYGFPQHLDYVEVLVGVSREILPLLTADFQVYYSPDYQGETGRNWVFEGGLARKFGKIGSITPKLSARLGYSAGDEAKGGIDYYYWNAGMSFLFADYFEFDLRYYDTFDVPAAAGGCRDRCDGRVVARITFEN